MLKPDILAIFRKANLHKFYTILPPTEQKIFIVLICIGIVGLSGVVGSGYRAVTEVRPASGGQITEGVVGRLSSINPLTPPKSDADLDLRALVHAGLLTVDKNGDPAPLLAESLPEVSDDLKVYKVKLRPGLKWQDGKPITADDVVYTVKSIQGKDTGSYLRTSFRFVTVHKVDDLTVEFRLREPSVTFTDNLLAPLIYNTGNGNTEDFDVLGAGPYKVKKYKFNSSQKATEVELAANKYFYPHEPYIKSVTIKFYDSQTELIAAYRSKLIDNFGFFQLPENFKPAFGDESLVVRLPQYQAAFFNLEQSDILKRPKVREALTIGTNRQELASIYSSAQPIGGPILGSLTVPAPEYSVERAKALLEEDGWKMNDNGIRTREDKPLSLIITTNDSDINLKTSEALKNQWGTLGVQVILRALPNEELITNIIPSRQYEVLLILENTGHDPDPYPFWHSSQTIDPGLNLSMLKDQELDNVIVSARATKDENARKELYNKFLGLIQRTNPAVFLAQPNYIYVVNSNILGMEISSLNLFSERFSGVADWYIKTKRAFR